VAQTSVCAPPHAQHSPSPRAQRRATRRLQRRKTPPPHLPRRLPRHPYPNPRRLRRSGLRRPPYFLSNGGITCHAGKMVSVNKGDWDKSKGADANHAFNKSWLAACQRVLKPNGAIWVSGTAHVIHSVGFAMQQLNLNSSTTSPGSSPTLLPISPAAISLTPPKPSSGPPKTKSLATPSITSS
jgi:hypothetical protein